MARHAEASLKIDLTEDAFLNHKKIIRFTVLAIVMCLFSPAGMAAVSSLNFTVNMSEAVTVDTAGGVPRIAVDVGGVTRYAVYNAGTGTSALTFSYAPVAGDVDLDGVSLSSPIDLQGGTMRDAAGNNASLTFSMPDTAGVTVDYPSLSMDFIADSDGRHTLNGAAYDTLSAFLTATGATFTRASVGTYFDSTGVLRTAASGVPRFDHDPETLSARGILIEESRTNSFQRSEEIENAYWSITAASVNANVLAAPDGTMTAEKLVEAATSDFHSVSKAIALSANTARTISVFAKAGERNWLRIFAADPTTTSAYANYNLTTGVTEFVGGSGGYTSVASIQNVGNGWFRCALTYSLTQATSRIQFVMRTEGSGSSSVYAGDGSSGLYLWGAQLETGPFSTSYIPTTTASVIRNSDTFKIPVGGWFNASLSTLSAAYVSNATVGQSTRIASLNDVGQLNVFQLANAMAGTVIAQKAVAGSVANSAGSAYVRGASFKIAGATDSASGPLAVNDVLYSNTNAGTPASMTVLDVGSQNSTYYLNGWIKYLKYYPARVTNTQLKNMTQ